VLLDTLVVLQTTIDFPGFPAAFVVENIGEFVEVALVEFDTAISAVGNVGFASKVRLDVTRSRVVAVDR